MYRTYDTPSTHAAIPPQARVSSIGETYQRYLSAHIIFLREYTNFTILIYHNPIVMRIIHTSDWHLGHKLYEYDRFEEQRDMLEQITQIVEQEQPDALVVSGDIFHTSNPNKQIQRLFNEQLLRIQEVAPQMQIVVSSGNHDSGLGLEVARDLWDKCGISIVGQFEYHGDEVSLDKHIIEVQSAGKILGYIVAIPYAYPSNFPHLGDKMMSGEERQARFVKAVLDEVVKRNDKGLPVVLMAHLFVVGAEANKHDTTGGLEYVRIEDFGENFDYLALGHIHKPYTFSSKYGSKARYCGSPLAVSFDEEHTHTVSLVTFEGRKPCINTIPITPLKALKTLPEQAMPLDDALKDVKRYLREHPDQRIYLRLNTSNTSEELPLNAREQVSSTLQDSPASFCLIKTRQREQVYDARGRATLSVQDLQEYSPLEMALDHYRRVNDGEEMSEDLAKCLQEVIRQYQEE